MKKNDSELYGLILKEEQRQSSCIELIASENFTSDSVMEALGSVLTNKYSEGLPGNRYYGGTEIIDKLELLTKKRAISAFNLSDEWDVNVQPYSGSIANLAALNSFLKPNDKFMGLSLNSGGHLSHGHYIKNKKINISSIFYNSIPYFVNEKSGLIDYNDLEKNALLFFPKLIISGGSSYSRDWDYERLRKICDNVGALLMVDISHFSGLIATKLLNDPFKYADLVTTTTHKSLRGPRGALFFFKKKYSKNCNFSVFPCIQGGPHNNNIAGICTQLNEVQSDQFKKYSKMVIKNSQTLCQYLMKKGYKIVSNGTDTHLFLWDLRLEDVSGSIYSVICDYVNITLNKNSIPGDTSPMNPGGVRIGSPAMTTRGLKEEDFIQIGIFLEKVLLLCKKVIICIKKESCHDKISIKYLKKFIQENINCENHKEIKENILKLKKEITEFSQKFPLPGKLYMKK